MTAPSFRAGDASASPPPGIHLGQDGFLFLTGGRNKPLAQYRPSPGRWLRLRRWEALIRERERRAAALGIRFLQAVVPEKLSVYPEKAPSLALDPGSAPAKLLAERLGDLRAFVDLLPPLLAAKGGRPLYRRADSHWTHEGALVAHHALCRALGVEPGSGLADRPFYESEQAGDLGAKFAPPLTETVRHYAVHRDARRIAENALVRRYEALGRREDLHRGAEVVYRNETATAAPLRLVLFGDSCAHWAPFLLTGMLAETVRELRFVWSVSIDWGYVERHRPDVVIGEIAERFLAAVPDDRFDLERFAAARLAELDRFA